MAEIPAFGRNPRGRRMPENVIAKGGVSWFGLKLAKSKQGLARSVHLCRVNGDEGFGVRFDNGAQRIQFFASPESMAALLILYDELVRREHEKTNPVWVATEMDT